MKITSACLSSACSLSLLLRVQVNNRIYTFQISIVQIIFLSKIMLSYSRGRLDQWKTVRFVNLSFKGPSFQTRCKPSLFQVWLIYKNVWHQGFETCRKVKNHETQTKEKLLSNLEFGAKGNVAWRNWFKSTLLCNSTTTNTATYRNSVSYQT